jgi:hypothetical protein
VVALAPCAEHGVRAGTSSAEGTGRGEGSGVVQGWPRFSRVPQGACLLPLLHGEDALHRPNTTVPLEAGVFIIGPNTGQ